MRLGLIGLSEGNGHPYSWSAIINGYDAASMEQCGYPVIPRYLEQQKWPESRIQGAEVVAVWTQSRELSRRIAKAGRIETVVTDPAEMVGAVDAVLLARDDAENHLYHAEPFLRAGLPIYIDKPIALTLQSLRDIYDLERYPGQVFTCSAMRYSRELTLSQEDREDLGEICDIIAVTPKSWDKYSVHIIEPVLNMLSPDDRPSRFSMPSQGPLSRGGPASLCVEWSSGIKTAFFATGDGVSPISIRVIGTKGWKELVFTDAFSAFKRALIAFLDGAGRREVMSPVAFNTQVVDIIERGRQCVQPY